MTKRISIIAIVGRDRAIGIGGDQPWHISEDFRRFKSLTLDHPIVMGRKTFEALPKGALPGRRNIVVTRDPLWSAPGVETVPSLARAIELTGHDDIFIIGGGTIYTQAMPLATHLYLTEVDADTPEADTFFPAVDPDQWHLIEASPSAIDPLTSTPYRFAIYSR